MAKLSSEKKTNTQTKEAKTTTLPPRTQQGPKKKTNTKQQNRCHDQNKGYPTGYTNRADYRYGRNEIPSPIPHFTATTSDVITGMDETQFLSLYCSLCHYNIGYYPIGYANRAEYPMDPAQAKRRWGADRNWGVLSFLLRLSIYPKPLDCLRNWGYTEPYLSMRYTTRFIFLSRLTQPSQYRKPSHSSKTRQIIQPSHVGSNWKVTQTSRSRQSS